MGCDARAISALYAEDATVIDSDGYCAGGRLSRKPTDLRASSPRPSRLEHAVTIGDDIMLRAGSWSRTIRGRLAPHNGAPGQRPMCLGTTWQIQTETIFTHSG